MRLLFEMTGDDLVSLMESMIMLQCGTPSSVQENANRAWARLGEKMSFNPFTVKPAGRGGRFFSAESTPSTP